MSAKKSKALRRSAKKALLNRFDKVGLTEDAFNHEHRALCKFTKKIIKRLRIRM